MGGLPRQSEWLQSLHAVTARYCVRNVVHRLRSLADRNRRHYPVFERVYCRQAVLVLESDVNARAIARRPDAMRQLAHRNRGDLGKIVGTKHLDFVESPDRHVSERAASVAG